MTVTIWLIQSRTAGRIAPVFDRLEEALRRELVAGRPPECTATKHAMDEHRFLHSAAE
jgi:hypothetical protein